MQPVWEDKYSTQSISTEFVNLLLMPDTVCLCKTSLKSSAASLQCIADVCIAVVSNPDPLEGNLGLRLFLNDKVYIYIL